MITEDQLEQLAIQWFQDTGWNHVQGAVIAPEGVAAEREVLRTLTPALSQRAREEDGRLAEVRRRVAMPGQVSHVFTRPEHRMGLPFRAWNPVGDGTQGVALGCRMVPRWGVGKERGKPLNKERRYPIALTMRGPWGGGLPRLMGFPWASADGFRRSLGRMPCWGGRIERRLNP
jgi:type I restriction enzyme R subunit